jgi:hypothetical protein
LGLAGLAFEAEFYRLPFDFTQGGEQVVEPRLEGSSFWPSLEFFQRFNSRRDERSEVSL